MPSAAPSEEHSVTISTIPISPTAAPSNKARRASLKVLNRNIDKVVLGNLLFRTWYYSPYPDSIILGDDHAAVSSHGAVGSVGVAGTRHQYLSQTTAGVEGKDMVDRSVTAAGAGEQVSLSGMVSSARVPSVHVPCDRLHVCPYCFRYTPKAEAYVQHLRRHTVTYDSHETSGSSQQSNTEIGDDRSISSSEMSADTSTWPVPGSAIKVYEYGGYTVWDVDGEREKLYCQNLSLFGKLFLEQKSVFFDTGGFHYFVLTYTPPPPPPSTIIPSPQTTISKNQSSTANHSSGRRRTSSSAAVKVEFGIIDNDQTTPVPLPPDITLRTRILGFFSKENLSWDANNLACILIFPPYQHRNLGQLLMAVSYKLSGWEWEDSIIGGPEKPLSAMGRRSYLRFWSERVARFLMGQTADADGRRVFDSDDSDNDDGNSPQDEGRKSRKKSKKRKRKKAGFAKESVTVKEIGDRTGMLAEDVIAALGEMGVLEVMPPPKKKRKSDGDEDAAAEEELLSMMVVQRSKVLEWVRGRHVDLVSPVKEEGFLGEWALSDPDEEEMQEEEIDENG